MALSYPVIFTVGATVYTAYMVCEPGPNYPRLQALHAAIGRLPLGLSLLAALQWLQGAYASVANTLDETARWLYQQVKGLLDALGLGGLLDGAASLVEDLLDKLGIKMQGVWKALLIFATLYFALRFVRR